MGVIKHLPENPSEEEMGTPYSYDPMFNGVEGGRKCTDIFMLIIFLIFFCGMLALFFYALPQSNVSFLYVPTDHKGQICGYDNTQLELTAGNASVLANLTDKPYLFWIRPGKKGYARSLCVEKCPESGMFKDLLTELTTNGNYFPMGLAKDSQCGSNASALAKLHNYTQTEQESADDGNGYFCEYATFLFAQRCFPSTASLDIDPDVYQDVMSNLTDAFSSVSNALTAVTDVYNQWKMVAAILGGSLVLSIVWLILLKFLAGFFVWLTVLLSIAALAAVTYMLNAQRNNQFNNYHQIEASTFGLISKNLNQSIFNVLFWIMVGIDVIFFLVLLFLCDRIKLSIGIIKIVSKVFGSVWSLFFFPIITYLLIFIWWAYIIGVAVVLYGTGEPTLEYVDKYEVDRVVYVFNTTIRGLSIYHFVGFLWVSFFISALSEMSVAGVFASHYFSREPRRKNMGSWPMLRSFGRSLRYHTGSLATGALIMTICRIIRWTLEYIDQKTKNTQSTAVRYLIKCMKCCFWCLEKFLRYLNRNVYILIAIHGEGFWPSCVKSFQLILRNIVRVATINWVGDFTLFLGKVFVSGATTAGALYYFSAIAEDVVFPIAPSVVVGVLSYFASSAFTGVFEMGIDSVFLCFMEDEERHIGVPENSAERFTPEEVRDFLKGGSSP